jgi:hypothetical protein
MDKNGLNAFLPWTFHLFSRWLCVTCAGEKALLSKNEEIRIPQAYP